MFYGFFPMRWMLRIRTSELQIGLLFVPFAPIREEWNYSYFKWSTINLAFSAIVMIARFVGF